MFSFLFLGSPWHIDIMASPGLTPLGESTRLVPAHTPAVFEVSFKNTNYFGNFMKN